MTRDRFRSSCRYSTCPFEGGRIGRVVIRGDRPGRLGGFTAITLPACPALEPAAAREPGPVAQTADALTQSAGRVEADVRFLADDLLEGRAAGTRGFDLAALYVAARYRLIGLEPAGEVGSYFRRVPRVRGVREREGARLSITRTDRARESAFETEFLPAIDCTAGAAEVTAPLVFVGQGVYAPELQHDDFAGADVRGRIALLETGELRGFDLGAEATLAARARLDRTESRNVIARLPGADPGLAGEHVVFTAHLDHLGIGAPHDGDSIGNGAQDNAVGIATMLETERLLAAGRTPPKRSMLFLALTAEEKGLLGAYHFAAQPAVPRESLVTNLDMDMPVLIGEVSDVVPVGTGHSTLEAVAQRAVAGAGLTLTPDPLPEEVVFVRSDPYPFVRQGVPAICRKSGVTLRDGGDGLAAVKDFRSHRHHLPNDDLSQPLYWPAAAQLAHVDDRIAVAIGAGPMR